MITHIIYHIPGRKVGCTKDLEYRRRLYEEKEGSVPEMEVLEELQDASDQEAGDREWWWATAFGYKRRQHYAVMMNALSIRGRFGGAISSAIFTRLGRSGMQQRASCPHCGLESGLAILHRWHFDRCPRRRIGFVRGN